MVNNSLPVRILIWEAFFVSLLNFCCLSSEVSSTDGFIILTHHFIGKAESPTQ